MFVLHECTEQPVLLMRTCTGQQIYQVFLVLTPPKTCQSQIHGELNQLKISVSQEKDFPIFMQLLRKYVGFIFRCFMSSAQQ